MSADVDISGFIEQRQRFEQAMKPQWREIAGLVALLIRKIVLEQFEPGGGEGEFNDGNRLRYGTGSLAKSFAPGQPYNVFVVDITNERVRVENGSEHPALAIHEFGGFIRDKGGMLKYMWARYIQSRLPYWKILALAVKIRHGVRIKARPIIGPAEAAFEATGLQQIVDDVMDIIARTWNAAQ